MIALMDETVVFASHLVHVPMEAIEKDRRLTSFHKDEKGIYCYTEEELIQVGTLLREMDVLFDIESLETLQEHKDKVSGMKYNSRTEAIKHINGEIEVPEQAIVPFLKMERDSLREQLDLVERKKDNLEAKVDALQANNESLLSRINSMESSLNIIKKDMLLKTQLQGV